MVFVFVQRGDKFVVNGILMKLARDSDITKGKSEQPFYMYGSNQPNTEWAMKSISHEMRYAAQYMKHLREWQKACEEKKRASVKVFVPL
jgi:hypothetical protein